MRMGVSMFLLSIFQSQCKHYTVETLRLYICIEFIFKINSYFRLPLSPPSHTYLKPYKFTLTDPNLASLVSTYPELSLLSQTYPKLSLLTFAYLELASLTPAYPKLSLLSLIYPKLSLLTLPIISKPHSPLCLS